MIEPETLAPALPSISGPTWRVHEDGSFWLPDKTLGWELLNWLAEYVTQPSGPHAGEEFIPTLEQARFLLWWYAVDDDGRFIYRSGTLRRMKGWGKDPLVAAMSLLELCGPVAFSHWDEQGDPVGTSKHSAWIQIAAVSHDQTRNTFTLFPAMASDQLRSDYSLDVNKTIIYSKNGGMIEGVTSSPMSLEGKRPTFVVQNETQWWLETNDGHAMAEVIAGNVDKAAYGACRALSICNAHIPGQDSVGERDYDAFQDVLSGASVDTGILYDALEAPADTPVSEIPPKSEDPDGYEEGLERLRQGLYTARGDSEWIPIDTILLSILDPRRPVTESRRKWLNQVNAHEDSWIAPSEWDSCYEEARLSPGDRITLGFDGSKSNDHTALVACRIEDGVLFLVKTWNPEDYPTEEVPRDDVDDWVNYMFNKYEVVAFRADVREFEAYIDQWTQKYRKKLKINATPGNPVAFDMRGQTKRFGLDCERFLDACIEGELAQDGNRTLRTHILNARRHPTRFDSISIRKESKDSSKKIDAAVCAVLAFGARQDFLVSKHNRSRKAVMIK